MVPCKWLQVIEVLEKEINESAWFGLAFLVDGFPRTLSQAKSFEGRVRPGDLVLYFDCPEATLSQRLTERGKTSGRSDDTPSSVKQRLKTFKKETQPLLEFFQSQGKLHKYAFSPFNWHYIVNKLALADLVFYLASSSSCMDFVDHKICDAKAHELHSNNRKGLSSSLMLQNLCSAFCKGNFQTGRGLAGWEDRQGSGRNRCC